MLTPSSVSVSSYKLASSKAVHMELIMKDKTVTELGMGQAGFVKG